MIAPDTINGFPVIASAPTMARGCERSGRIIVVDRGAEYEERFVVAWQAAMGDGNGGRTWAKSWDQSAYCEALSEAMEVFGNRLRREVER